MCMAVQYVSPNTLCDHSLSVDIFCVLKGYKYATAFAHFFNRNLDSLDGVYKLYKFTWSRSFETWLATSAYSVFSRPDDQHPCEPWMGPLIGACRKWNDSITHSASFVHSSSNKDG